VLVGRTAHGSPTSVLKVLITSRHCNASAVQLKISSLPPLAHFRFSAVMTDQSVVTGGTMQSSSAGELQLPRFNASSPAVVFVRVEEVLSVE
jgi:hypothetical protein